MLFVGLLALFSQNRTLLFAEQSGGSPESGSTSRLITSYDWLVDKANDNYGVNNTGSWLNDWGTNWNRIMISAAWAPDGDLALADVFKSKTFYSGTDDRTQKTGTLDSVLLQLSDFYEAELEDSLKEFTTILEPIIMLIIGVAVGAMVIMIIAPIYSVLGGLQSTMGQ